MSRKSTSTTKPGGNGNGHLPDAELDVISCLWQQGECTARDIREAMEGYRPMTHGSMVTLLKRLESKGWVTRRKGDVGKAFVYRATRRPEPTQRRLVRDMLRRVFGGSGVQLVSTLLDSAPPTEEELDKLQDMFDDLRARRERDEGVEETT